VTRPAAAGTAARAGAASGAGAATGGRFDGARLRDRLRVWLRPPRRLRFTRAGWLFTAGALAIGVAAIPTGNNLLFLVLGAMLGFIAVSGWLSEQTLRGLRVERRVPRGVTAGQPARLWYRVGNAKRRLPTFSVTILEKDLPIGVVADRSGAWLATLPAGAQTSVRAAPVPSRRGVHPLRELTLATGFPFGLFEKERDVALPGELVVWPRADLLVREPRPGGRSRPTAGVVAAGPAGGRGEFRGLREYRPGDDPRDIHWRSSARSGTPIVREYERDAADVLWLCVDTRRPSAARPSQVTRGAGDRAEGVDAGAAAVERAIEVAASLAAAALERGRPVGLAVEGMVVSAATGPAQLERVLDALARVDTAAARPPSVPVAAVAPVLVSAAGAAPGGEGWADVFTHDDAVDP